MKIGLNLLRIQPGYKGGINTFTFGLLDGFAASSRAHEFVIFAAPHNRSMFDAYVSLPNFRIREIVELAAMPGFWGRLRHIARDRFNHLPPKIAFRIPLLAFNKWLSAPYARKMDAEADIIYTPYGPSPLFPYPGKPTVYSIHDVQDIHFPQFFTEDQRLERGAVYQSCTRHAALMQASSEQMRDDFLANFPALRPENVVVIHEGVNIEAYRQLLPDNDVCARYGLPDDFMYFPAQLWHHKNHMTVLRAISRLKNRGINTPLVMTGAKYDGSEHLFDFIAENGLNDRVFYLSLVPSEDVLALHHAAKFLITAVLYESSSIPILEAAAAGTPVIASQTPANEERARDLQLNLFTPTNDVELSELLEKIWRDDALLGRQVRHNNDAIQKFSWNRIADNYLDMFEDLAARRA